MEPTSFVAGQRGEWYILAPSEPELNDGAEWLFESDPLSQTGQLVRAGMPYGRLRRIYDPLNPELTTRGLVRVRGSRRFGFSPRTGRYFRSGPQADAQATLRGLTVLGMMETAGMTHGVALREWTSWPETPVPAAVRLAVARIAGRSRGSRHLPQAERDSRLADRQVWAAWERAVRRQHRETWRNQGLITAEGAATGITIVTSV